MMKPTPKAPIWNGTASDAASWARADVEQAHGVKSELSAGGALEFKIGGPFLLSLSADVKPWGCIGTRAVLLNMSTGEVVNESTALMPRDAYRRALVEGRAALRRARWFNPAGGFDEDLVINLRDFARMLGTAYQWLTNPRHNKQASCDPYYFKKVEDTPGSAPRSGLALSKTAVSEWSARLGKLGASVRVVGLRVFIEWDRWALLVSLAWGTCQTGLRLSLIEAGRVVLRSTSTSRDIVRLLWDLSDDVERLNVTALAESFGHGSDFARSTFEVLSVMECEAAGEVYGVKDPGENRGDGWKLSTIPVLRRGGLCGGNSEECGGNSEECGGNFGALACCSDRVFKLNSFRMSRRQFARDLRRSVLVCRSCFGTMTARFLDVSKSCDLTQPDGVARVRVSVGCLLGTGSDVIEQPCFVGFGKAALEDEAGAVDLEAQPQVDWDSLTAEEKTSRVEFERAVAPPVLAPSWLDVRTVPRSEHFNGWTREGGARGAVCSTAQAGGFSERFCSHLDKWKTFRAKGSFPRRNHCQS